MIFLRCLSLVSTLFIFFVLVDATNPGKVSECGGLFTNQSGIIRYEKAPQNVTGKINCVYKIQTPPGSIVVLTLHWLFAGVFCNSNFMKIYSSVSEHNDFTLLTMEDSCNKTQSIMSPTNEMTVYFQPSRSKQSSFGFLVYRSLWKFSLYTADKETVESPNAKQFPAEMDYLYFIRGPPSSKLLLKFNYFNLGDDDLCSTDSLSIKDENIQDVTKSDLCGSKDASELPVFKTPSNVMILDFKVDNLNLYKGFSAKIAHCGGRFGSSTKSLSSPFYPEGSPSDLKCLYHIQVPYLSGETIIQVKDLQTTKGRASLRLEGVGVIKSAGNYTLPPKLLLNGAKLYFSSDSLETSKFFINIFHVKRFGQTCDVEGHEVCENGFACDVVGGSKTCGCEADFFWNGESCQKKKLYKGKCSTDDNCLTRVGLSCVGDICICDKTHYWDIKQCGEREKLKVTTTNPSPKNKVGKDSLTVKEKKKKPLDLCFDFMKEIKKTVTKFEKEHGEF